MKWQNQGHEFDSTGKKFLNVNKVYIVGAGAFGKELYETMRFLDIVEAFVDTDPLKQKTGYLGKTVISQQELLSLTRDNLIVVVAVGASDASNTIKRILISGGLEEGYNLFDYYMFINYYLYIFSLYRFNKLYFNSAMTTITQYCTLKCKYCCQRAPYNENPRHYSIEDIIHDVDLDFKNIDFIDNYFLTGGGDIFIPKPNCSYRIYVQNIRSQIPPPCAFD